MRTPKEKKILSLVLSAAFIAVTAGCGAIPEEHKGATIGAGAGAATGAVVGGVVGDGATGAVVGGLLGALAGGAVGHYAYDQRKDREETAQTHGYYPDQGTVLRLESTETMPQSVSPGETVDLQATYAVLTPESGQPVEIQEIREITHNGQQVGQPTVTVSRPAGTYTSTIPLKLSPDAEAGTYEVTTTVKSQTAQDTRQTQFVVR